MANFNEPTVDTNYTQFPQKIQDNIDVALQQLSSGSHSNIPDGAIKWDAQNNKWVQKVSGSFNNHLSSTYNFTNIEADRVDLGNNERLRLGNSQNLQLYHSGSQGFIDNSTGTLSFRSDDINLTTANGSTDRAKFGTNFELYASGNLTFKSVSNGCQVESGKSFNVDNGTFFVDPSNNRVGISTTSPQDKIEISNNDQAHLRITNTAKNKFLKIGVLNDSNGTGVVRSNGFAVEDEDGNSDLFINTNGSVGIGTTSQGTNKLVVAGNQIITTHLEFSNTVSAKTAEAFISKAATNTLAFGTANSNRVYINGDGKLGVGGVLNNSDDALIQISGTSSADDKPYISCSHGNNPSNNDICGGIEGQSGTNNIGSMFIKRDSQGATAGKLVFATQPNGQGIADRMIITSVGHIRLFQDNSSSPGFGNTFTGVAFETAPALHISRADDNTTLNLNSNNTDSSKTKQMILFRNQGNQQGSIRIQADGSGIVILGESDYRLKENIVDINDGIARLKKLKPKRYNFIKARETNPTSFNTYDGFLAHEVSDVCPEAVVGEKDGVEMQSLDPSKLITVTVAALQELIERVEKLEAK
tara:strand:- start:2920 stop:4677 length:1758 start_codon:yes stop_codon:yes gene_type:complete